MPRCECPKEMESQSVLSPGIVQDNEPITFGLIFPESFNEEGHPRLSHSQLRTSSLSVCRAGYVDAATARQLIVGGQIERNPSREDRGTVSIVCEKIRSVMLRRNDKTLTGIGAFCVIDDSLEGYRAHAHIGYSVQSDPEFRGMHKAARLELEEKLAELEIQDWENGPFTTAKPADKTDD